MLDVVVPSCEATSQQVDPMSGVSGESVVVPRGELARLRAVEDAARWHYANSACAGWPQGEVLALALDLNPEAPAERFARLLDALGIRHDGVDPLSKLLEVDDGE